MKFSLVLLFFFSSEKLLFSYLSIEMNKISTT